MPVSTPGKREISIKEPSDYVVATRNGGCQFKKLGWYISSEVWNIRGQVKQEISDPIKEVIVYQPTTVGYQSPRTEYIPVGIELKCTSRVEGVVVFPCYIHNPRPEDHRLNGRGAWGSWIRMGVPTPFIKRMTALIKEEGINIKHPKRWGVDGPYSSGKTTINTIDPTREIFTITSKEGGQLDIDDVAHAILTTGKSVKGIATLIVAATRWEGSSDQYSLQLRCTSFVVLEFASVPRMRNLGVEFSPSDFGLTETESEEESA